MVYEFESADIIQPVMYPAMARSFREAGMQWATQFAYDPLALAYANTEYQTHYLNLAYTPAKALSLLIAGQAFRRVGRGQSSGRYPADSVFDAFHVSYRLGLSEMNTPAEFYYTANTTTAPARAAQLRHVAGVGSSAVVRYGGSGAYFLDRLAPGVWRLEVMPDAVAIRDPFEKTALSKPVTQILWNNQPLRVTLPDLGPRFTLRGLNAGNTSQAQTTDGATTVRPGVYLLATAGRATSAFTAQTSFNRIKLGEFVAPAATELGPQVRHTPPTQTTAGQPLQITATLTGIAPGDSVLLIAQHYFGPTRRLPMTSPAYATVTATVPAELLYPGQLHYWLVLKKAARALTFPGGFSGQPGDWDYAHAEHYAVAIVPAGAPLPLFEAARDQDQIEARGLAANAWTDYVTAPDGALTLRLVQGPPRAGKPIETGPAASLRAYFGDKLGSRARELAGFTTLVVRARASQADARATVTLTTKDAVTFAAPLPLGPEMRDVRISLSTFRPAALLLVPRPYPGFLPLHYQPAVPSTLKLADAEVLQIIWEAAGAPGNLDIESVSLQ